VKVENIGDHINVQATTEPVDLASDLSHEQATSSKHKRVPRPPNAFILFRQHHHPALKTDHPDLSNSAICK